MIFQPSLRTSGSEVSSRLIGPDPQWAVEPEDYYYTFLIVRPLGPEVTSLPSDQEVLSAIPCFPVVLFSCGKLFQGVYGLGVCALHFHVRRRLRSRNHRPSNCVCNTICAPYKLSKTLVIPISEWYEVKLKKMKKKKSNFDRCQ